MDNIEVRDGTGKGFEVFFENSRIDDVTTDENVIYTEAYVILFRGDVITGLPPAKPRAGRARRVRQGKVVEEWERPVKLEVKQTNDAPRDS